MTLTKERRMVLLFFFQFIQFVTAEYNWLCTDQFCQNVICRRLPEECSNSSKAILIPSIDACNCCDHCLIFHEEGETCARRATDLRLPESICGPGLYCNEERRCEKMEIDPYLSPNYRCNDDGMCHCTVMESGRMVQIFGTFPKSTIREGEIQCECSLVAYKANNQIKELRALPPGFTQPTPRCLPNGQFDPLQCIEDKCGCVEQDTGTPDENGFIYSLIALGEVHPICFDKKRHRLGYYTDCEIKINALIKLRNELFWNDTNLIFTKTFKCSPDGEYKY